MSSSVLKVRLHNTYLKKGFSSHLLHLYLPSVFLPSFCVSLLTLFPLKAEEIVPPLNKDLVLREQRMFVNYIRSDNGIVAV